MFKNRILCKKIVYLVDKGESLAQSGHIEHACGISSTDHTVVVGLGYRSLFGGLIVVGPSRPGAVIEDPIPVSRIHATHPIRDEPGAGVLLHQAREHGHHDLGVLAGLGVLAALIGVIGIARPQFLVNLVEHWQSPTRFRIAVIVRIVLGVVLLIVAPSCRVPVIVSAIGVIAIVAALIILAVGRLRLDAFIKWWLIRPRLVGLSAVFAVAFGALLIYAGA